MDRTILAAALCAAALPLAAAPAVAAGQIVNGGGQLTGATGVTISGTTYDVEFVEGTCASLFGGCGGVSNFTFQSQSDAQAAAQALLDQVFTGAFDSDYTLTFGCNTNAAQACLALIPYGFDQTMFAAATAKNVNGAGDTTTTIISGDVDFFDTTFNDQFVWARFTPSAGAVPEPASWALMLLGFAGIGVGIRRRRFAVPA